MKIIFKIDGNNNLLHSCSNENGSEGCPLINSINFQVIGIHFGRFEGKKFKKGKIGRVINDGIIKFSKKYYLLYYNKIENFKNIRKDESISAYYSEIYKKLQNFKMPIVIYINIEEENIEKNIILQEEYL